MNATDRCEKFAGFLDRHVEYLGDGFALVVDLQGFPVVARAVADLAGDVDVGQEVHLDFDGAVAGAGLAASALDVERESARLVAPHLRLGGRGEQGADLVEDSGVGGRVGSRGTADRRLVHLNQLVDLVKPVHSGVSAGDLAGPVESISQHGRQDVVDQG